MKADSKGYEKAAFGKDELTEDGTGKQVKLLSHASSPQGIEYYNNLAGRSRRTDVSMKGLLSNSRFSGALLRPLLKELKDVSIDDFCRYTNADIDTGNVLGEATEIGSTYTKDIRLDVVFEYDSPEIRLRIDEEPQIKQQAFSDQSEDSYSLVGRAVYYASVTMATELLSKERYHEIRKVYSIWICYHKPIPEIDEPVISYSLRPTKDYRYTDGEPLSNCKRKFDNGDLLEIILISVKDVEKAYFSGDVPEGYTAGDINILYYLLSENMEMKDRVRFYHDQGIIKEGCEQVSNVSIIEQFSQLVEEEKARAEEEKARAEEEKARTDEAILQHTRTIVELGRLKNMSERNIIDDIMRRSNVPRESAAELYNRVAR